MMKRVIGLVLCLMLLASSVQAVGEEIFDNTQAQKLLLQFLDGSGMKGAVAVEVNGEKEWAQRLSALNGRSIQLTAIDDSELGGFQYLMYINEQGEKTAQSEIFSDGSGTGWLRSDFLPDTLVSFPAKTELLSSLSNLDAGNPSWYISALRLMLISQNSWKESWEPRLTDAYLSIDSWMNAMGGTPMVLDTEKGKVMLYRCEISVDALKAQMKAMLPLLLGNEELMTLLSRQVSREQEALYLHEGYQWYYEQCIDHMPLTGSVVLERQVTALGEPVSMLLSLPVTGLGKLKEIDISQEGNARQLSLIYEDKAVRISGEVLGEQINEGEISYQVDGEKNLLAHYTLQSSSKEGMDEKGRNTERYEWSIKATPALEQVSEGELSDYIDFAPFQMDGTLLLYSLPEAYRPTTMELVANLQVDECDVKVQAKLKTSSSWEIPSAPQQAASWDLATMTKEERATLWEDWLKNLFLGLSVFEPADPAATEAPMEAPTEATAQQPESTVIPLPDMTAAPDGE